MTLKEALDAAHGHEHNEDGSEITPEQKAAQEKAEHGHSHEHGTDHKLLLSLQIYAGLITLLFIGAAQLLWSRRARTTA